MPSRRSSPSLLPPPEGFGYLENVITADEESELVRHIEKLPLKEFEFQGYQARRRTISFGWHYDFSQAALNEATPIPEFLIPLREKAATFARLSHEDFPHVLVTEYTPGTPIGWHRDKPVFDVVAGISLLSACPIRFRRKSGSKWERFTVELQPRSIYLLRDEVRSEWEHSIAEVERLRYSITFRSLR